MSVLIDRRTGLARDPARAVVAGVCAGVARRVGVDPLVIRIATIAATAAGIGLALYILAWALLPATAGPAGAASARGRWQAAAGAAALALAALLLLREWDLWVGDALVWPAVMAAAGVALLLHGAGSDVAPPERPRTASLYRGGFGVALVAGAALITLQAAGVLAPARDLVVGTVVIGVGLALVLAPVLVRMWRDLGAERAARIRAQERAEVAAHLHDSVLQTLALVQRQADDPRAVALLARRQERDLRAWLAGGPEPRPDERLADAVRQAATEVELAHGVRIEVVAVGDAPLDARARALVAAGHEALVNAAKFAGGAPIDAFVEADPEGLRLYVRDRGPGFDPGAVRADRRGVRESIIGRMARHGGRAEIRSAPGAGTEVELAMPRAEGP